MSTLSVTTANVSAYTIDFGQPNKNNHLNMFALSDTSALLFPLSVVNATVNVDMIIFCVHINNCHLFTVYVFTLSVATATISVDTIIFCVYVYSFHFQCVYTKHYYCKR